MGIEYLPQKSNWFQVDSVFSCRFSRDHESVGVVQTQPAQVQPRDSQLAHHQSGAENTTTSHVTSSSPLTLNLLSNDSTSASSIGISSSRDSTFDYGEYEADLVFSAALVVDKQQYIYDQAEESAATQPESVQVDSSDRNDERYVVCNSMLASYPTFSSDL